MIIIVIAVVTLVALYLYGTRTFKYWDKRGIKHDTPLPFVGNNADFVLMKKSVTEIAADLYRKYPNEKVVGFFRWVKPEILLRDPEIIKRILTTDFLYFHARGITRSEIIEPLERNLAYADGDLWRLLRHRMTPAFSSGKLKAMFPLISERAERLQEVLAADTPTGVRVMDTREIIARYYTDFIVSVGFGIESDSISDENSAIRNLGASMFDASFFEFVKGVLKELFPEILKHLSIMYETEKEITSIVQGIQKRRNYEPSGRNDFMDLFLECKKKGTMVGDSIEKVKPDGTPEIARIEMDDTLIAAQVYVLFAAGFEPTSTATSYTLHELAYHPKVQKKVQEEIDRVLPKYDNKICYDAIKEMSYLELAFREGMRMFSPTGFLKRECTRKYTIEELNITIDPGVSVMIPLQALHNDPAYFDNPEEFRPERFHPDEFSAKDAFVCSSFGEGPRACIGARLGLMQSMAGIAAVLSKYSVEPAPETLRHPPVNPTTVFVNKFKGGLPLIFRARH